MEKKEGVRHKTTLLWLKSKVTVTKLNTNGYNEVDIIGEAILR